MSKFDIKKRQKSTFNASVENVKLANDFLKLSQNWLWSLGIAELSFFGVIIFKQNIENFYIILFIKILVVLLLSSFISFIWASALQYKHILGLARFYEKISNQAIEYLQKGEEFLNKEPSDLGLPKQQIISSKLASYLFFASYLFTILATLGLIIFIIFIKL